MNLLIGFLNYSSSRKGERLARIIYLFILLPEGQP